MSTLSSLVSDLRNYIKSDPNDKIWGSAIKESAINSAYFQIQKDGGFRWPQNEASTTQVTVGGTAEYALPTDFIRLEMVQFSDTLGQLTPTTKQAAMRNGTTSQGRPSNYYLWNQKLGFYSTPDTAYPANILYRKRLATLTGVQDSLFPSDFDNAIVRYAAYILWSTTKNQPKTGQALDDYRLMLGMLKDAYLYQDTAMISFPYQRGVSRRNKFDPKILDA